MDTQGRASGIPFDQFTPTAHTTQVTPLQGRSDAQLQSYSDFGFDYNRFGLELPCDLNANQPLPTQSYQLGELGRSQLPSQTNSESLGIPSAPEDFDAPRFSNDYQQAIQEGAPISFECPIMSGRSDKCSPDYCGSNPPCFALQFPDIEECTNAPCLEETVGSTSPSMNRMYEASIFDKSSSTPSATPPDANPPSSTLNASEDQFRTNKPSRRVKQSHSLVERKYREGLNSKIAELHQELLSIKSPVSSSLNVRRDSNSCSAVRKSEVLSEAIRYIGQSELEMRHMANEIQSLRAQVASLEKRSNCADCSLVKQLQNMKFQVSGIA